MACAKTGDTDSLKKLIENGLFDPKGARDKNGSTALMWAAGSGRLSTCAYLLDACRCSPLDRQRGKNRGFRGRTALHWAARNGHTDVCQLLVEDRRKERGEGGDAGETEKNEEAEASSSAMDVDTETDDGTTAFCWASWQSHVDTMRYLFSRGCDVHATNSFGCNAVMWCAQGSGNDTLSAMKFLASLGCDFCAINDNGHGVLHKAAQRGKWDVCQWLLDACNNNNVENDIVSDIDRPFHLAIDQMGPDAEECCPSDLAGMEGFLDLADWLSCKEKETIISLISASANIITDENCADSKGLQIDSALFPMWLRKCLDEITNSGSVENGSVGHMWREENLARLWEKRGGIRRMAATVVAFNLSKNDVL
mmetsp:Transcript_21891/g.49798  ORF Transcript_21891/g.49798 Transcript_21891/m.49798 type:complete len:367 (+) Transcript_21891:863-1963(+)